MVQAPHSTPKCLKRPRAVLLTLFCGDSIHMKAYIFNIGHLISSTHQLNKSQAITTLNQEELECLILHSSNQPRIGRQSNGNIKSLLWANHDNPITCYRCYTLAKCMTLPPAICTYVIMMMTPSVHFPVINSNRFLDLPIECIYLPKSGDHSSGTQSILSPWVIQRILPTLIKSRRKTSMNHLRLLSRVLCVKSIM